MAATIQGIYVALFGRPADPAGLAFFNSVTGNGADLTAIGDLASTEEYQSRFTGMSNTQVITSIYQSLFGHGPDSAGLNFYLNALASGDQTINTIAIHILDGAQGDDLTTVNAKIDAANLFTSHLDQSAEVAVYVGDDAAAVGREFITGVTGTDPGTAEEADAAILKLFPDEGQQPGGGGGGGSAPLVIEATATTEGFDSNVTTSPTPADGVWYTDRHAPAGFQSDEVDGRSVLVESINAADAQASNFENTQGRAYNLPDGTVTLKVDLFIPDEWSPANNATDTRHAGFWGTGVDHASIEGYPIIEFATIGGVSLFRVWEPVNGGWHDLALPANFSYDSWQTLEMSLNSDGSFTYKVGDLEYTSEPSDSYEIGSIILQGYNTAAGRTYDVLWDSVQEGPTVHVTQDLDLSGLSRPVAFEAPNVFVDDGVTLEARADQVSGVSLFGYGTGVITEASNADFTSSMLNLEITGTDDDDDITGGFGTDDITGGSGWNDYYSSAGGDTYHASADEQGMSFVVTSVSHSAYGGEVTTTDFGNYAGGYLPVDIYFEGSDFDGARTSGAHLDEGLSRSGLAITPGMTYNDFFIAGAGENATSGPATTGDHYIAVYNDHGGGAYTVYVDANGDGDLNDGDAQFEIVGSLANVDINSYFTTII